MSWGYVIIVVEFLSRFVFGFEFDVWWFLGFGMSGSVDLFIW